MGKLVVTEFVSLDDVFEEPRWTFEFDRGEDGDAFKGDELREADAQLLGRVTYEGFAAAWPSRQEDWFGKKFNEMPKYVVSNSLSDEDASWTNSHVIRGDVAGAIAQLKEQIAGSILVAGSATLVRALAEHDLVDEYRLMQFPIVLGSGRRLFDDGFARTPLRLLESKTVGPDGVLTLTYEPAR
jgi:dihydrofolate reductase